MTDITIDFIPTETSFRFGLQTEKGDIKTDDGLTTAVIYSLFTDRRANADDVIPDGTQNRRGHWGDTYLPEIDESEGSRLWLLARAKQTTDTLNKAIEYSQEALQWLIDQNIASAVNITAEWIRTGTLAVQVQMTIINGQSFQDTFEVTL